LYSSNIVSPLLDTPQFSKTTVYVHRCEPDRLSTE
jgi:hypothetical protein